MRILSCLLLALSIPAWAANYTEQRMDMIETINELVELTAGETGRAAFNPAVMAAMAKVRRHELVPPNIRAEAYANRPLPIGHGQTISQPYIVALMTDLLDPKPEHTVLEIGTGSGYQAAVLAEIVARVYTIEIVGALGERARDDLARLGYANIEVKVGDGYYGWEEHGPFDGIVVTAVAGHVPPALVRQLKPGGRMVIPVGGPFQVQQLTLVEKDAHGKITTRQILPVRFVPLTGGH